MRLETDPIGDYCVAHSHSIPEYLIALERATFQRTLSPQMLCGSLIGRLLSFISRLTKPTCIVEFGTFTGYSALCLAEGLSSDGILHTFESNDELLPTIEEFQKTSPYYNNIQTHIGLAESIFPHMDISPDLAFIDAGKTNYIVHYNLLMRKMKSGGMIIVDNVLWDGKVVFQNDEADSDTMALKEFNQLVANDPRCIPLMLPIRDGLTILMIR